MTDEQQQVEETPEVEVDDVTRERDEYLDALQRLKAEFENYRKRVARDQGDVVARASERLAKQLLPVLDDLERALEAAAEHEEAKLEEADASTIEGRVMELRGVLESSDVNEIRQKTQALQEASQKLAEAVYAQASAQQAQASGNGETTESDDEVIEDAEVVDEEAKTS